MTDRRSETSALNGQRGASKQWKGSEQRSQRITARLTPTVYKWLTRNNATLADEIERLTRAEIERENISQTP